MVILFIYHGSTCAWLVVAAGEVVVVIVIVVAVVVAETLVVLEKFVVAESSSVDDVGGGQAPHKMQSGESIFKFLKMTNKQPMIHTLKENLGVTN